MLMDRYKIMIYSGTNKDLISFVVQVRNTAGQARGKLYFYRGSNHSANNKRN